MNAEEKQIAEIKRVKEAIKKTQSPYLKRDYQKYLRRLEDDLKEYYALRGEKTVK